MKLLLPSCRPDAELAITHALELVVLLLIVTAAGALLPGCATAPEGKARRDTAHFLERRAQQRLPPQGPRADVNDDADRPRTKLLR